MTNHGEQRDKVCEIIACLVKSDSRSAEDVAQMVGVNQRTAMSWIQSFHKAGMVRELRRPEKSRIALWQWQRYPFEFEDFAP